MITILIMINCRKPDGHFNNTLDLVPNFSRTDGFKYSFFNRVVDEWNGLPNQFQKNGVRTTSY